MEDGLVLTGHRKKLSDLVPGPGIDATDLVRLLTVHLGQELPQVPAGIPLDLAFLHGEGKHAAEHR
ncbi:MAG: hypothetical protein QF642_06910 [Myxococcota bacterium]|nr:hypothetical protein [Myxococcota bacterium]